MHTDSIEYIGFWSRVGASFIDTLLLGMITWPVLTMFYGDGYWSSDEFIKGPMDFIMSWLFPAVAVVLFWAIKQATPGKMAIKAKIVDATTLAEPSVGKCIGRYLAYFISLLPLGLGFIWVAFDDRKQGWHDKLSGTIVIRKLI
jgi:uncharacterized RDD family membrane protein YckC